MIFMCVCIALVEDCYKLIVEQQAAP